LLLEELRHESEETATNCRCLTTFAGLYWGLPAVVDDFRVLKVFGWDLRGSLAVVGKLWGLWAAFGSLTRGCGFDADLFG
jgi:hypothetical protein